MGDVWRAFDPATNREVAVKVLKATLADDPQFEERFRREAFAAAGLANPHVVPIHYFGEIDGRLYVDMRLIEGRDLEQLLASGALDPGRAVSIVEQVASALHAAHKIGLVHRDLKPPNILIDEDDFAYLIDFGIARAANESGLTSTGAVVGTLAYMAPERLNKGHTDARADVYALTCVLHECLTGSHPFPTNSLDQQIAAHLTQPPPLPSALKDTVPTAMDTVIATGMAKNPDNRYPTIRVLARAARDAMTTPRTGPAPTSPPEPGVGLVFRYAARSDRGFVRETNDDSVYASARLLAVADGVGEPAGGKVASQLVIAGLAHLDEEASDSGVPRSTSQST